MSRTLAGVFVLAAMTGLAPLPAQPPNQVPPQPPTLKPRVVPPSSAAPVEKLGPNLYRLGEVRVDTGKREVSVAGTVNTVTILEFVANTIGGAKAYESALTLQTHGMTFNAAMILIGLDKDHARVPTRHFDPVPPRGDRVGMWIDWMKGTEKVRTPVEHLLYDQETRQPIPASDWVYTGSSFAPYVVSAVGTNYLADLDGVLIGFVHSPAPIIENVAGAGVSRYGQIVMNPNLGLAPETPVTLTVKALGPAPKP